MPYTSEYMRGKGYNGNFFCAVVNGLGNVDLLKYDTSKNEWFVLKNNFAEGLIYYAVDILDGYFYLTGGYSYSEESATDSVYTYDIVTDITAIDRAVPVRSIGFEYEQTMDTAENVEKPEIKGVSAKIIDKKQGIYQLTVDDYTSDPRSVPFFFWNAREGVFSGVSTDFRTVMFYADPGTGDREVKVVVGIGDGRGYSDKKSFNLTGNNNEE